jgi:hypothetical protein
MKRILPDIYLILASIGATAVVSCLLSGHTSYAIFATGTTVFTVLSFFESILRK